MATIERSPGIGVGGGWIVGAGYTGTTAELDATVKHAADTLADAYRMPVTIRFNTDRHSGGAWLKTDDPDGVWLNAEVGICADLVTAERNARSAARYPDMADRLRPPGIYVCAHVGKRVGEYAHEPVETVADALAYVQAHADLSRLTA
jgi:hypothetical protein